MNTKHTDSVEAYIKVTLDYAPKENGEEFDKWCEKYGFTPLDSGRRAWSSNYGTYFRDALEIACTVSGETFIFIRSKVLIYALQYQPPLFIGFYYRNYFSC